MKLKWYAAHIIVVTKLKKGRQKIYPVLENIVLVAADTDAKAWKKAEKLGKKMYDGGDATLEGKPAIDKFVGVRKLIACIDEKQRPVDGTELTYSFMRVDGKATLNRLVTGKSVKILYEE